jgi:hypothetical protein
MPKVKKTKKKTGRGPYPQKMQVVSAANHTMANTSAMSRGMMPRVEAKFDGLSEDQKNGAEGNALSDLYEALNATVNINIERLANADSAGSTFYYLNLSKGRKPRLPPPIR